MTKAEFRSHTGPENTLSSSYPETIRLHSHAREITTLYVIFGLLWIFFSDRALAVLVPDPSRLVAWSSYKGFAFVSITAGFLFLILQRVFGTAVKAYGSLSETGQALRSEKQFNDMMIESMPGIIYFYDMNGRFLRWNKNFETVSGYSGQEIAKMHPLDFFSGQGKELVKERIEEVFSKGESSAQADFIAKDGTATPYFFTGRSVLYEGKPCLVGAGVDISARKDAEDRLRKSEQEQRLLAEQLSEERARLVTAQMVAKVGSWETDMATGSVTWSLEAYRIFGMDPGRFNPTHENFLQLVHPEDRERVDGAFAQSIGQRSTHVIEHRLLMPEGSVKFVEERWRMFYDEEGRAVRAVGTCRDITERKTSEMKLAESQGRYRKLFECAPDGIVISDPQSRYLDANPSMCRMLGYSYDEFIKLRAVDIIDSSHASKIDETIEGILKNKDHHRDWRFRRKDGTVLEAEVIATLMPDGNILGMIRDISERRQAEAEREKRFRAEAADRIKSAFLATMSHELRTPLNSIIGFTGILLQGMTGPLNPEQNKQLEMVRVSALHLLALVNDVLDISKIEAGQLEIFSEPFDISHSIQKVLAIVRPQAEAKRLELRTEISSMLKEAVGDERRFEQVLLNLLSNAIKFTAGGRITLSAQILDAVKLPASEEEQSAFCLKVSDTGIGIKPEDLSKLFQPFRQIDSGLARNYEGTGLGLAICGRLTDLMGGTICAESSWGKGSTFTVTLPLKGPVKK